MTLDFPQVTSVCGVAQIFQDWEAPQGNINVNDFVNVGVQVFQDWKAPQDNINVNGTVNVGVQVFQKHCISRFLHILYILHTFHILHILYKTAYREVGAHYSLKCSTYSTYSVAHCSVVLVLELALCSGQSGLKVLALGEEVLPSTHQPNHQPSNCDTHQDGINGYNYKHT